MVKIVLLAGLFALMVKGDANKLSSLYQSANKDSIPSWLKGNFMDDYQIKYSVNDSLFYQWPNARYHIIRWNMKEQYFITRNDIFNPTDGGLYTRIDFMPFENMQPFLWGFCYTTYNAKTDEEAERTAAADRKNPMKGCGGFPFSRMKRID